MRNALLPWPSRPQKRSFSRFAKGAAAPSGQNEPLAHANFLPNRALVEVASTLRRVLGDSTGGGTSARAREGVAASVPAADARKSGVRSGVQKQRGRRGRGSEARREEARREAHP